ncbi:MAG: LCP family protein [Ruminococcus sp.]|nr:LCP family protein [Ruminococcus sp.]
MNDDTRRTPVGSASDSGNSAVKDKYQLEFEAQMRRLEKASGSGEDYSPFTDPSLYQTEIPPRARAAQPQKPQSPAPKKKKGKSSSMSRQNQQHIDRSEPLKFGAANTDAIKARQKHPVRTFFIVLLIIILVIALLLQLLILRYLGKVTYLKDGDRSYTSASMKSEDVLNVLVIGSDTRDADQRGRTDSMILLSIDKEHKRTTMTSFMRDSYVVLPGYDLDGDGVYFSEGDWCKLNAAYVYGGAEMLMDTIEYNFDIAVDKYVYVDFYSFIDIVDAVGGIELDISDEEAEGMIPPMREQNEYLGNKKGTDYLQSGGKKIKVNGNQALAYARLRYVGNADFERTQRQRTVMKKILEKARDLSILDLDKFICTCAENVQTNMTKGELYKLTYRLPFMMKYDTEQLRIPSDDAYSYGTGYDGSSVLIIDLDQSRQDLKKTIY